MMFNRRRMLPVKVLVKRPAAAYVHQLNAAADAEHRYVQFNCLLQQIFLHPVALRTGLPTFRQTLCTVQGRCDILPAGEQETAADTQKIIQFVSVRGKRHDQRYGSASLDHFQISRNHPDAVCRTIVKRRNAYADHTSHLLFIY